MRTKSAAVLMAGMCVVCLQSACSQHAESDLAIVNPFGEPVTLAVAPVLNFSGALDFDPLRAADFLASELTFVRGVSVLPVNRVVAYLAMSGKTQIESPSHAVAVAEGVGADAILVAGITEYDAYTPVVGLALQMYTARGDLVLDFDPVLASRSMAPPSAWASASEVGPSSVTQAEHLPGARGARGTPAGRSSGDGASPAGQVQVTLNGRHAHVVDAVRRYARDRSEDENPLGWRQYLKVQTLFLRFCWHEAVARLMATQYRSRMMVSAADHAEIME